MGGIIKAIVGAIVSLATIIVDVVVSVVSAVVEFVAAIFGIQDQYIISTSKVSSLLYAMNDNRPSKKAIIKAVLGNNKDTNDDVSFFDHYWYQINNTRVNLTSFYRQAKNFYPDGLPTSEIHGLTIDETEVLAAVNTDLGASYVVLSVTSGFPSEEVVIHESLQNSPHFYSPALDTLTYTDSVSSVSYDDWNLSAITYNAATIKYDLTFQRQEAVAQFWLEGDGTVVEGGVASYTIHSTRTIPAGLGVDVNLAYAGSAVDGADYTQVSTVNMAAGSEFTTFDVVTTDTVAVDGTRDIIVSIASIDNSAGYFEGVAILAPSSVSTLIFDNDTATLYVSDGTVSEGVGTIDVDVTLLSASASAFTVDYATLAGTATVGADYTNTSGTLSFAGTLNESHIVTIPILTDLTDDSGEQFTVALSNVVGDTVDSSSVGTITITDASAANPSATTRTVSETYVHDDIVRVSSVVAKVYDNATNPLGDDWEYWIYDVSSGTYPNVDTKSDVSTNFELFPIVTVRKNKVNIDSYGSDTLVAATEKLLSKLNLKLDDILDSINDNPDVDAVHDAYINLGISPSDQKPEVSKLLWGLFYPVMAETPVSGNQGKFFMSIEQGAIKNAITWKGQQFSPNENEVLADSAEYAHQISGDTLILKHQVNPAQIDRISVIDIGSMATIAYDAHTEIASNALDDDNFTVPVSWYSLNKLSPAEQMDVYEHVVRMDIYALTVTKIAWYKTAAFMKLFQVVLIIVTFGYGLVTTPAIAGAATVAEAGFTSVLFSVGRQIAINYVIAGVVSKVAKATGNPYLAAAVGIIAAISLGNPKSFEAFSGMFDAKSLLKISTNFVDTYAKASNAVYTQEREEMVRDLDEFNRAAEGRLEAIQDKGYDTPYDPEFSAFLRSVTTSNEQALTSSYDYDSLFDYDSIVADYNKNLLTTGLV